MIFRLFTIGLACIPFTGIPGLPFLGELKNELSAYVFFLTLALAMFPAMTEQAKHSHLSFFMGRFYGLPWILFLMLSVIALSFMVNFPTIKDNVFMGRTGLDKFISATVLILYGFSLATLAYILAGSHDWNRMIVRPLAISVIICAGFSVIEITGHYVGGIHSLYTALSEVVHGGILSPPWDLRLRSVAAEPPDFANTAGYIWPWLLAAAQFSRGTTRLTYLSLWAVLNVMIVLSEARTSLVVVSGLLVIFFALRAVYLPLQQPGDPEKNIPFANALFFLFLPLIFLVLALNADDIVRHVVIGNRVSNLSRLASMTAAFHMFEDSPLFGFGYGQFGFHVSHYMPSWGFLSYEIRAWLFSDTGYWPAVYSIYARFAADMGILGVLMWVGIWLFLARAVLFATLRHRKETGELPFAAYPLIMSCFCVLLAGIPNDSIRAPMIWINMGLACRYLHEMRTARLLRASLIPSTQEK